tara:strand:- start:346 stop:1209 length:864 start_codon:yes stop_codon:yes gene_type:complete
MKILVTGGSGFLGSHVADELSNRGHKVVVFDIKKSKWIRADQKMCVGSILNFKSLEKAIKGSDIIFHFAALADLDEAAHKPIQTVRKNIMGTVSILELAKKYGVKRFIYASSIYSLSVQGGFYRCSKKAAEDYIEEYYKNYGLNFTIIRYGSLYGTRTNKSNGVYKIVNDAIKNKQLQYVGSKKVIRKYINVLDASKASANTILPKYANKYVNITGERSYKVTYLLNTVSKFLKLPNRVKYLNASVTGHYIKSPKLFKLRTGINYRLSKYIKLKKGIYSLIKDIKKK